jgi:hypothetical protein
VRVKWRDGTAFGGDAVWFKDRKGDLFAIHKGILSIFKYSIPRKCY